MEEETINTNSTKNDQNESKKGFSKGLLSFVWEFLKIVIIAAVIVLPIRYFLFQPFIVKGDSMVPNLQSGNYLIIDEISYRFKEPNRGDVVVLNYPLDNTQRFIKRIIGLPGEVVEIKNGKVTISKNGEKIVLDETSYLPEDLMTDGNVYITLKDSQYFVLGDNRQFSYDSRKWGILPKEDIIGKAAIRLFPITSVSFINSPNY
ncbi:MAG: Signal peptidase I [Parcubacteria group bacterium GW2011_GWA2_33_14]|uniref:Signal peptidase I n=1 Tax=Candidatus Staskawiczbacteria bacterium RIFCSPHIGHO2_02_FULL_33_16 TaxID=1802204 RepID=A0A1G2HUB2_9BACT|nr:MAG: Signal peptidase I [Parcubacteria group bacterium GW2011_GWA2_33_14]OGZ66047.1 MAG: signal peptidase I [Candidatus Staskawiczbacteria bacterium RIFCSPHIGHO2_02_FULL_33_16]OGZ70798.1 MAG: signal peptidase I [Candidatus Staskawiczbacteria bacterium RIFCSPLOWO2_01_FULL_33_13]